MKVTRNCLKWLNNNKAIKVEKNYIIKYTNNNNTHGEK